MLIIIIWMVGFALLHSITADRRVKAGFARVFGERVYQGWYRLLYNLLSLILLMPVSLLWLPGGEMLWQVPDGIQIVFLALSLVGLMGAGLSILQIDSGQFAGIAQVGAYLRGDGLPLATKPLTTTGLYRFVRHPLYFFSLMAMWFVPTMTTHLFAFNVVATLYFVVGSLIEERRMLRIFGDEYAAYQQQVAWLVPLTRKR